MSDEKQLTIYQDYATLDMANKIIMKSICEGHEFYSYCIGRTGTSLTSLKGSVKNLFAGEHPFSLSRDEFLDEVEKFIKQSF